MPDALCANLSLVWPDTKKRMVTNGDRTCISVADDSVDWTSLPS